MSELLVATFELVNKTPTDVGQVVALNDATPSPVEPVTSLSQDPSTVAGEGATMDRVNEVRKGVISIAKEPKGFFGCGAPTDTTAGSHHDDLKAASQLFMFISEPKLEADELLQSSGQGMCSRFLDENHVVDATVTNTDAVINGVPDGRSSKVSTTESAALIREQSTILRQTEEKKATGLIPTTYIEGSSQITLAVDHKVEVRKAGDTNDEKSLEEKAKMWAKARRAKFGPSIYPVPSNKCKSKDSARIANKKKKPGPNASAIQPTSFLGEVAAVMNAKSSKCERIIMKKPRKDEEDSISAARKARVRKQSIEAKSGLVAVAQRPENRKKSQSSRRTIKPSKDPSRSPSSQNTSCTHELSTIDSSSTRSKTPQRSSSSAVP
jgi:hypothetical protein